MSKPKIIIRISDGIVRQVFSDTEIDIDIIDSDIEDLDEEDTVTYTTQHGEKVQGYIYSKWRHTDDHSNLIYDPKYTNKLSKEISNETNND